MSAQEIAYVLATLPVVIGDGTVLRMNLQEPLFKYRSFAAPVKPLTHTLVVRLWGHRSAQYKYSTSTSNLSVRVDARVRSAVSQLGSRRCSQILPISTSRNPSPFRSAMTTALFPGSDVLGAVRSMLPTNAEKTPAPSLSHTYELGALPLFDATVITSISPSLSPATEIIPEPCCEQRFRHDGSARRARGTVAPNGRCP
jgi:hypothetical protein